MAGCRLAADSPFRIRNVQVLFYITTTMLMIWSFSFGATFDAYLLELSHSRSYDESHANEFVGSVETVRGLVALFLALPLGILADRMNRRIMIKWSSAVGTIGILLLCLGIGFDATWLLYSGVVVAAIFMQIFMSCGQALLADSVPKEQLTTVMATQGSLYLLGYSSGPLAQMGLIAAVGDTWSLDQLHIFLIVGFCLWPIVLPAYFLLERTRTEQVELQEALTSNSSGAGQQHSQVPRVPCETPERWNERKILGIKKKWLVPLLIEFCSLITAMGAGMTVKFFPLFFKQDYKFDPISLCGLSAGYTICIAFFVQLCRKVSDKFGRCQAALLWHVLGTLSLFVLWKAESLPFVIFIYIIRGSFMNAKGPIDQAIVMDCVDTTFRGRWSALQSISRFSWSGSAILGGLLADSHDYRYTFLVTGFIYATAAVLYVPLLFMVPARPDSPPRSLPNDANTGGGGREDKLNVSMTSPTDESDQAAGG